MKRHCFDSVMQLLTEKTLRDLFMVEFPFFRVSLLISVPFLISFPNVVYSNHPVFGTITVLDSDTIFIKLWTENQTNLDKIWDIVGVSRSPKPESAQNPHLTFELYSNDSFRKMRLSLGGPNDEADTKLQFLTPLFSIVPDLNSTESGSENIGQHVAYSADKFGTAQKVDLNVCKETLIHALEKWYAEYVLRDSVDIPDIFRKVIRRKLDAQKNVELLGEVSKLGIVEALQHAVNLLKRRPDSTSKLIIDDTVSNAKNTQGYLNTSETTRDTFYGSKNKGDKVRDTDNFRERSRLNYDSGLGRNFLSMNNQRIKGLILRNKAKTDEKINMHNISNFKKLWYCLNECNNRNKSIVSRNITVSSKSYPTHIYNNSSEKMHIQKDNYEDGNNNSRQALLKQQNQSHFSVHTFVPQMQNTASRLDNGSSTSFGKLNNGTLIMGKLDNNSVREQSSNRQRNTSEESKMYEQEFNRNAKSKTGNQSDVNNPAISYKLIERKRGLLEKIRNQQDFLTATRFRQDEVLNIGNKSGLTLKNDQKLQSENSSIHITHNNITDTERINLASSNETKKHEDIRIKAHMRWFYDSTNYTQIAEGIGAGWGGWNDSNLLSSKKNGAANASTADAFSKDLKSWHSSSGTNRSANDSTSFSKNNYTESVETVRKTNTTSTASKKNTSTTISFIKDVEYGKKIKHAINSDIKVDKKSSILSAMEDIVATVNDVFPSYQKKEMSNNQDSLSHFCGNL